MKNSIKQMLRTPFKTICFSLLIAAACSLLTVGTSLWVKNRDNLKDFEEQFMTVGTVEQKASSVVQESLWDAEKKDYEIYQYPQYAQIYPASVLEFEGADYIQKPEKRSYYASYAPDYKLVSGRETAGGVFTVVEFSPLEDCVPNEAVKIKIEKVFSGDDTLTGSVMLFCNHENENPEPLYKGKRYIASIAFNHWAHGSNVETEDAGRIPEYAPQGLTSSQYGEDGVLLEDPLDNLAPYYEVTPEFYETEIGKRYLNLAEGTKLLGTTFPVTGTNSTKLLMPFYDGEAYIVEGNDISKESYTKGDKVCLISEVFAKNNYLRVGDKVHTRFYFTNSKYPAAWNFGWDGGGGFNFNIMDANGKIPAVFEAEEYEIVGIYSVDAGNTGMGGDEMIVPMNSIEKKDQSNILAYGPMNHETTSFQIPNGTIEKYMREWEKQGVTDLDITFYDKGYTNLKSGIENMKAMSVILCTVGICMSIALLFLINYLFVSSQKKKTAIERSLGVSKRKCIISMLSGIYLVLIIGSSAGGVIGFGVSQNISVSDLKNEAYDVTYSSTNSSDGENAIQETAESGSTGAEVTIAIACAGVMTLTGICIMAINAGYILRMEPMKLLMESGKEQ